MQVDFAKCMCTYEGWREVCHCIYDYCLPVDRVRPSLAIARAKCQQCGFVFFLSQRSTSYGFKRLRWYLSATEQIYLESLVQLSDVIQSLPHSIFRNIIYQTNKFFEAIFAEYTRRLSVWTLPNVYAKWPTKYRILSNLQ